MIKKSDERYQTADELIGDLLDAKQNGNFSRENKSDNDRDESKAQTALDTSPKKTRSISKQPRFNFWKNSSESIQTTTENEFLSAAEAESKGIAGKPFKFIFSALGIFIIMGAAVYLLRNEISAWKSSVFNNAGDTRQFDALRPVILDSWKTAGGFYTDYRVSHNGKLLAYSSSQEGGSEGIFVRQTAEGEEIRVTKDQWTNVSPIWSPDDQRLAYSSQRENQSGIYVSPALGGSSVPLKITGADDIRLRHWSNDGASIYYELNGNLYRVEIATQETFKVTDFPDAPGTERHFSFSPEEERLAFCDKSDGREDVWIMSLKGGEKKRLTVDGMPKRRPRWHPDGRRILYNVQRDNFQQVGLAFTDASPPVQITRGDSQYEMIDVSADGTRIYYSSVEDRSDIGGVNVENGEEFEVATGIEYEHWSELSPDGKAVLYQSKKNRQIAQSTIIVKLLNTPQPVLQLEGFNPRWLRDSRHISFLRWSQAEQKNHLFTVNIDSGEEKQLTTNGVAAPSNALLPMNRGELNVVDFSIDTGRFAYVTNAPRNVWLASVGSGESVNLTNNESPAARYSTPLFSADGKRFVFLLRETTSEKMTYSLWISETNGVRRLLTDARRMRLLGWAGDEILLEMTDGVMSAAPLDVRLLRVTLTGESRILTIFKSVYADSMTLSAEGKSLVFTARQNNKDDLWTAPAEGGEPKKITSNSAPRLYYASPAWSPDGKTIYFDKQEQIETISMFENFK